MHLINVYSNTLCKRPLEVQCHFSFDSQGKYAEEVGVQVNSSWKIVMSGLPCKIGHRSTAILKTFGDFSLAVAFSLLSSGLTE